MKARGEGHIVSVGSIFALRAAAEWAAYSASKHGVVAFTEAVRKELAQTRIRISLVHPGSVQTEFGSVAGGREPMVVPAEAYPYPPLLPEKVAEAILWIVRQPTGVEITDLVMRPTAERSYV